MLCEFAYYRNEEKKPRCTVHTDAVFGDRCPLIYLCPLTVKYENTAEAVECTYRKGEFSK